MDIRALERDLAAASNLEQIMTLMTREFAAIGLGSFTYVFQIVETFHTPPCICMTTLGRDFLAYYKENAYFNDDPLMGHFTRSNLPLFYTVEDDWRSYGPQAVAFQQELKNWGFLRGVVLPFFTTHSNGYINLHLEGDIDHLLDRLAKVNLALPYFNEHVKRVYANAPNLEEQVLFITV